MNGATVRLPAWCWNPIVWVCISAFVTAILGLVTILKQEDDAREVKGWLSGEGSWAYFEPARTKIGRRLAFFVRHAGKYPTYDVVLRIHDELEGGSPGDPIAIAPTLLKGRGFDWHEPKELIFSEFPTLRRVTATSA